jgi:hypothetical protein
LWSGGPANGFYFSVIPGEEPAEEKPRYCAREYLNENAGGDEGLVTSFRLRGLLGSTNH